MKISSKWYCLLASVLGCLAPARGYCEEAVAAAQPSLVQPAVSRWDAPTPPPAVGETVESPILAAPACGDCSACESSCTPGFQWIVGVEATFFWPQFNRSFLQNTLTNSLGTQTTLSTTSNGSAEGTLLAAPRITFGVQGERWGLVGRYWYASTWASGFAPSASNDPAYGLVAFDGLRAYTTDLEVQRRFCLMNWDAYGFLGIRYASVNNDRTLLSTNSFDGPALSAASFASQQFNGAGMTFGMFATRPIWCDDSPLKMFIANRYSFLWGNGAVAAQTTATSIDGVDTLTSTNGAAARGNGDMFIAELQLGLQWEACLKCLPGRFFLRSALEYQYWDVNTGAQARSFSFVDTQSTETGATATARAGNMLFDLIGFNIGAGIMY